MQFMKQHHVDVKLGAANSTTSQTTVRSARFPGKSSFIVMEVIMQAFLVVRGVQSASELTREEKSEYMALREAHFAFSELLTLVWSREGQKEDLLKKASDLDRVGLKYQESLCNWLGSTRIAHYGHVCGHFGDMQRYLAAFGQNLMDVSGK